MFILCYMSYVFLYSSTPFREFQLSELGLMVIAYRHNLLLPLRESPVKITVNSAYGIFGKGLLLPLGNYELRVFKGLISTILV